MLIIGLVAHLIHLSALCECICEHVPMLRADVSLPASLPVDGAIRTRKPSPWMLRASGASCRWLPVSEQRPAATVPPDAASCPPSLR